MKYPTRKQNYFRPKKNQIKSFITNEKKINKNNNKNNFKKIDYNKQLKRNTPFLNDFFNISTEMKRIRLHLTHLIWNRFKPNIERNKRNVRATGRLGLKIK